MDRFICVIIQNRCVRFFTIIIFGRSWMYETQIRRLKPLPRRWQLAEWFRFNMIKTRRSKGDVEHRRADHRSESFYRIKNWHGVFGRKEADCVWMTREMARKDTSSRCQSKNHTWQASKTYGCITSNFSWYILLSEYKRCSALKYHISCVMTVALRSHILNHDTAIQKRVKPSQATNQTPSFSERRTPQNHV